MSINEQDDLKWWKNHHGPGMPTDWPKIEVCEKVSLRQIAQNRLFGCCCSHWHGCSIYVCGATLSVVSLRSGSHQWKSLIGRRGRREKTAGRRFSSVEGLFSAFRAAIFMSLTKPTNVFLPSASVMIGGVKVRALYDYVGEEGDELSFKAGDAKTWRNET